MLTRRERAVGGAAVSDLASAMTDRPHLLVVAPDDAERTRVASSFATRGFVPTLTSEAAHGWDLFLRDLPPFVLVDWQLPGGAGQRLVRQLREREGGSDLLVVALASAAAAGSPDAPLDGGVDDVLWRGAADAELSSRAAALEKRFVLRRHRVRREAARREAQEEVSRRVLERAARGTSGIGILEDEIAERRRAESDRERLAAALECAGDAIAITDADGRYEWANRKYEEITGWTREELRGKTPRILKSGRHDDEFYRQLWASLAVGETWIREFTNRRKGGELYDVEQSISPMRDASGRTFAFVSIQRDVSERKRHERELSEKNEQLAEARDVALAASRAKNVFLGTVSHELRTPLNAILGFAELLAEQLGRQPAAETLGDLARIRAAALDLTGKVDALLDISRLESGEMSLDVAPHEAAPLLREAAARARERAGDTGRTLTVDIPPDLGEVDVDAARVARVLEGLLANAFHHGGGCPVTLRARRGEGLVEAVVTDGGPGISPDRLAAVFTPFARVGDAGGIGLTLAVSHRLVQLMGGSLSIESLPGEGTVARLTLRSPGREK